MILASFLIVAFLCLIIYSAIILYYGQLWNNEPISQIPEDYIPSSKVSILIPCRNEKSNLSTLIESLESLDYPSHLIEIIIINDHSTDGGFDDFIHPTINLISLPQEFNGKKEALQFGVTKAKGEIIICSDADCTHGSLWVTSIIHYFESRNLNFVTGPIVYERSNDSNLQTFQVIDNIATMLFTFAGIKSKAFYQANGANMAFKKSIFNQIDSLSTEYASGDDVFLVNKMAQLDPEKILYLKNTEAIVKTGCTDDLKSFIFQRKRWASKSKATNSSTLNIIFGIVATILILIIVGTISGILDVYYLFIAIALFTSKALIDYFLLIRSKDLFPFKISFSQFLFNSIFYIPYFLMMTYFALIPSKYSWKDRSVR
jgi:cellulose synthase/poly-beta-1,6-N-acetylglucosamine synthase-like glycosyltransferase